MNNKQETSAAALFYSLDTPFITDIHVSLITTAAAAKQWVLGRRTAKAVLGR